MTEVEEDGAKLIYVIPLSDEKDLKFMINAQIPPYKQLAMARAYTGPEKFHFFGQYCLGPFKAVWENELAKNFRPNALHTNPAFVRALVGTWIFFYGQTDLRKTALKMISKHKWKNIFSKYEHRTQVRRRCQLRAKGKKHWWMLFRRTFV